MDHRDLKDHKVISVYVVIRDYLDHKDSRALRDLRDLWAFKVIMVSRG